MASSEEPSTEGPAFIGIARVREISGFCKNTILRKIRAGELPKPVISEGTCVRWDLQECLSWRAEQFKKREQRIAEEQRASA